MLVKQLGLPTEQLEEPLEANTLDGRLLARVTTRTCPVQLQLSVPAVYHGISEVFCKQQALSLPPHRPYDCAINLLPGSTYPRSRLYNISRPERAAMEEYINSSLAAGIIRPSSSPLGAGFFFVGKKDGTLRPCIDFREHIQHVHQVLQRLLENRLFVKAEKCEFHATTVTFLGHIIAQGSNWHSKSGDTGWRGQSSRSWFGLTIRTLNTSTQRSA
ncbi:uncharacterized protein LOC131985279 [Centropristis striata]|uniref:uncharacterized protein LOC131985279 n=1 Tax=Centropristis striata TaxID=184440 RepID=UPI0027E11247|nr:uncharacterized protein LOC131985279 [Centropristis striata]